MQKRFRVFAVLRYAGLRRLPYASLLFVVFFRIKERKASIKALIGKLVFLWLIIFWLFVIIDCNDYTALRREVII